MHPTVLFGQIPGYGMYHPGWVIITTANLHGQQGQRFPCRCQHASLVGCAPCHLSGTQADETLEYSGLSEQREKRAQWTAWHLLNLQHMSLLMAKENHLEKLVINRSGKYHPPLGRGHADKWTMKTSTDHLQLPNYCGKSMILQTQKTLVFPYCGARIHTSGIGYPPYSKCLTLQVEGL